MIEATVMRAVWKTGRNDYTVKAEGHAGAGVYGSDILCAAVSVLMQTLANEVENAAKGGIVAKGNVERGHGWMKVEVTPFVSTEDMVDAWVNFVKDGLDAIAKDYPDNVNLKTSVLLQKGDEQEPEELKEPENKKLNLQLFAEGGGDGGAAGDGAEAAPAVQAPELRPAQERLAKRSRPGRAVKAELPQSAAPTAPSEREPVSSADADPQTEKESAPGEEKPEQEPKPTDPAEKRKAFGQLMQGEYAAEFEEALQRASEMAVKNVLDNPAVKGLMDALGEAYGIDVQSADNLAALTEAVKNGKVKNDEYYETLAAERGISVKTAREMDRMESELQRANAEKQRAEQIRQAAEHQQRAAAVRAQWEAEAARLKVKYPAFELDEVLNNPSVADMIRRGIGLEAAYRAAYFDQLMEASTARTAQQVEQGVAARIQQRAQRPAENGAHPGGAAEMKVDVAHMTAKQRAELAKRARRGERIVL